MIIRILNLKMKNTKDYNVIVMLFKQMEDYVCI